MRLVLMSNPANPCLADHAPQLTDENPGEFVVAIEGRSPVGVGDGELLKLGGGGLNTGGTILWKMPLDGKATFTTGYEAKASYGAGPEWLVETKHQEGDDVFGYMVKLTDDAHENWKTLVWGWVAPNA